MIKRGVPSLLFLLLAVGATAQETPATESPLDDLLATPISTAAKYDQRISEVPASVTVITAEEIGRYGWHTLADVLGSVRGIYTSYDRGYTYLGVRGVGLPTDYNSRYLVLINGYPMIDTVSGTKIGTALAIDLSQFSRIELVRGPGSVMYGAGAMFGVINLITKDEEERAGVIAEGVPLYVEAGLSVAIDVRNDRPLIVINVAASRAEGSSFPAQLLQLARLVE